MFDKRLFVYLFSAKWSETLFHMFLVFPLLDEKSTSVYLNIRLF